MDIQAAFGVAVGFSIVVVPAIGYVCFERFGQKREEVEEKMFLQLDVNGKEYFLSKMLGDKANDLPAFLDLKPGTDYTVYKDVKGIPCQLKF